jgi:uncharacterized metal-binding protein
MDVPKRAVTEGPLIGALSRLLYLLSLQFVGAPLLSVVILLLGRATTDNPSVKKRSPLSAFNSVPSINVTIKPVRAA